MPPCPLVDVRWPRVGQKGGGSEEDRSGCEDAAGAEARSEPAGRISWADVIGPRAHPGIRVQDLDALAAHLTAHGTAVRWDDDSPGHRRFSADGPVGNRLEVIERDAAVPSGP